MQWEDITSYSRGDTERIPRVWCLGKDTRFRITVLTGHRFNPNQWVMNCPMLAIDTHDLGLTASAPKEDAQIRALKTVRSLLREALAELEKVK